MIGISILAHQGGWDEILMVAGPILVIVVALRIVKRRVEASADAVAEATHGDAQTGDAQTGDAQTGDAQTGDVSWR